jgi:DNA primase
MLEFAADVFSEGLRASPRAQRYLDKRGVSFDVACAQRVGYADGRGLLRALQSISLQLDTSTSAWDVGLELGLLVNNAGQNAERPTFREFFFDRIIFPELRGGRPIWFIGRAIDQDMNYASTAGGGARVRPRPKYLSLPGERPVLGLERVLDRSTAYLVEGPFDWLAAIAWDLPAFAICGTHVPMERLPHFGDTVAIYGVFDPDRAGRSAAERFAPLVGARWRPITLPNGMDLAELAARGDAGRELFQALVARARAVAWREGRF